MCPLQTSRKRRSCYRPPRTGIVRAGAGSWRTGPRRSILSCSSDTQHIYRVETRQYKQPGVMSREWDLRVRGPPNLAGLAVHPVEQKLRVKTQSRGWVSGRRGWNGGAANGRIPHHATRPLVLGSQVAVPPRRHFLNHDALPASVRASRSLTWPPRNWLP